MSYDDWKKIKLSEIVMSVSTSFNFYRNKLVLINTSDVLEGKVLNNSFTKNEKIKGQFKKAFKKGDILYSEIRPKNKRFAYIDFDPEGYVASTKLMVLRGVSNKVDNKFLYQILTSTEMINKLQQIAESRSGTFPQITFTQLGEQEIDLPPLAEQNKIANILSSLDDKIELNNKINKNLEEMAQILYKQWFVDFEFPNENGEPYKSSGGEMVESELGLIPKGWEFIDFSEIINISSGKRPPIKVKEKNQENKVPVLGASGIMAYTNTHNIDEKVLVIGRVGTHGVIQRIHEKVWSSDNTLVIKSEDYYFSYHILKYIDYKSLNRGSTQPLITQTDIKKTKIIKPNRNILNMFENQCESIFNQVNRNNRESFTLSKIRERLLPKLMSGEIKVPIEG